MKQTSVLLMILLLAGCQGLTKKISVNSIELHRQSSDLQTSMRGVSAVNTQVAWAGGAPGTFQRTVDGGKTWRGGQVAGAEELDFRDIEVFDADTALVLSAGLPAKIYKTTDGGQTWTQTYSNDTPGVFFDAMAFWDNQHGIAMSDPIEGKMFFIITDDGGESWRPVPLENLPPALEGEAGFAASGTCLTVAGKNCAWLGTGGGATARVFYTTDRGRTWSVSETPIIAGGASKGIFSLAFWDESNGIAVGGDYQDDQNTRSNAALTNDGGKTWILVHPNQPAGFKSCVAYIPNTKGPALVAVGTSGSDYSLDGGKTWTTIETEGYHSISFVPDGAGWAGGAAGPRARGVIKQ